MVSRNSFVEGLCEGSLARLFSKSCSNSSGMEESSELANSRIGGGVSLECLV